MNECLTTPQHEKQIGYWVSEINPHQLTIGLFNSVISGVHVTVTSVLRCRPVLLLRTLCVSDPEPRRRRVRGQDGGAAGLPRAAPGGRPVPAARSLPRVWRGSLPVLEIPVPWHGESHLT